MAIDKYFTTRRTIRKYSNRAVDIEEIKAMLTAASHAPTTGNMQLYSAVISIDEDIRKQLSPCHFNQPAAVGAPVLITFCADFNRFIKWCEASDAKHGFNNFQSFMSAVLDTTIFAQQFVTIAEMSGLGCCYLGTTTYNATDIANVLHLAPMVVPITTISLGYPEDMSEVSERIPVEGFIHLDTYHDYTGEQTKALYSSIEQREDSKRFIAENGKQTLAQVFTDVRYPRHNNELFSKLYRDFITAAGFPL